MFDECHACDCWRLDSIHEAQAGVEYVAMRADLRWCVMCPVSVVYDIVICGGRGHNDNMDGRQRSDRR